MVRIDPSPVRSALALGAVSQPETADTLGPGPQLYPAFRDALYAAVLTDSVESRAALFHTFNQTLAPLLVDDLSYFELLIAKMAQIRFPAGQPVRACIERERRGAPTDRWAADNVLTSIVASRQAPGFSFLLQPADPASTKACALCFPGTAPAYKRDILCARDYPRGVRDDLHWRGVGYEGYRAHRDTWLGQARGVLEQGRELWLVGHSLGAAYASEMMAYLQAKLPEHMDRVHLFSLHPPGLRLKTLRALAPLRERIHLRFHQVDVVPWVGAGHPAGTVYSTFDCLEVTWLPLQPPHAMPVGALRRLRGEAPRERISVRGARYHWLPVAEAVRLGAGALAWRSLDY